MLGRLAPQDHAVTRSHQQLALLANVAPSPRNPSFAPKKLIEQKRRNKETRLTLMKILLELIEGDVLVRQRGTEVEVLSLKRPVKSL